MLFGCKCFAEIQIDFKYLNSTLNQLTFDFNFISKSLFFHPYNPPVTSVPVGQGVAVSCSAESQELRFMSHSEAWVCPNWSHTGVAFSQGAASQLN